MASLDFDAGVVPIDTVGDLMLSAGETYQLQNLSTIATVFFRESMAAVAAGDRGFRIEPGSGLVFSVAPNVGAYVWIDDENGAPLILSLVA